MERISPISAIVLMDTEHAEFRQQSVFSAWARWLSG